MNSPCRHCGKGQLVGDVFCSSCSSHYPYENLANYESLSYFLDQLELERWKAAVKPELRDELLVPYRNKKFAAGLSLGLENFTEPALRNRKYATALYLFNDLSTAKNLPVSLTESEKNALLQYISEKRERLAIEYKHFAVSPPAPFNYLPLKMQKDVVNCSLQLLEVCAEKHLLSAESLTQLQKRYQERLDDLDEKIAAEIASKQAEQAALAIAEVKPLEEIKAPVVERIKESIKEEVLPPIPVSPPKPRREFKWENVWSALLSEATLHALLYLGALFIVVGAGLYITLNWNNFPALLQTSFLLTADLLFFGSGLAVLKFMKLNKSGVTLVAVSAAILPLVIYGYCRPELFNLDNRGTWSWISLLILPCYLLLSWFMPEKIFSLLTTLAGFNALFAILNQFGLEPEWLLVAATPLSALLVWADPKLTERKKTGNLAGPPYWVGLGVITLIPLVLLSYYIGISLAGQTPDGSVQYALGSAWWLATLYYAWLAITSRSEFYLYHYGAAFAGVIAVALTLRKFEALEMWYWPAVGLLGAGYMAGQSLRDLVSHLNFNQNSTPWHFSEVFAASKPFNNIGAALLLGSILLAGSHDALGQALVVLAFILTGGAIIFLWDFLIYGAVASSIAGLLLVIDLDQVANSLLLITISLIYFGLSRLLAPLRIEGEAKTGPLTYPPLIGWFVVGAIALSVARYDNWYSPVVTLALMLTTGYAAFRFKEWNFNWLLVGLSLWLAWNSYLLADPRLMLEVPEGLLLALLAVALAIVGLVIGEDYGRPFRWIAHPVAFLSILAALYLASAGIDLTGLWIQLSALVVVSALYGGWAMLKGQFLYFYPMALPLTLAVIVAGGNFGKLLATQTNFETTISFIAFGFFIVDPFVKTVK